MNAYIPIKTLIAAGATANGLLGERVYSGKLPQSATYPAAVIKQVSYRGTNSKTHPSGLHFIGVQIDVYGTRIADVATAADAIRTGIEYQSSGSVKHIEFTGMQDDFNDKAELFRKITEYEIAWQ